MKMKKYINIMFVFVFLLLVGCSSSEGSDKSPLTGTEWILFEMDGIKYESSSGTNVTLSLVKLDTKISGKAPCNTYGGGYTKIKDKLSFWKVFTTEMACADMEKESAYYKLLEKVYKYQISGDKLYLIDFSGTVILRYKAQKS
jgi:heat shock protein HslJ